MNNSPPQGEEETEDFSRTPDKIVQELVPYVSMHMYLDDLIGVDLTFNNVLGWSSDMDYINSVEVIEVYAELLFPIDT